MLEIITETLIDTLKLLPFLFLAYLLLEYIEHKMSNKNRKMLENSGRFGPIWGSILGAFPQCGFAVAASNLYAARIISVGTLVSVYLSTSDEMLPVLISNGAEIGIILKIILTKIIIGIIAGFVLDYVYRLKRVSKNDEKSIHTICENEHCECEKEGIWKSTLKHTLNVGIFILLVSFLLNLGIYYVGEESISNILTQNSILGPVISGIIGLIPNCAASVIITELYLNDVITFGSVMSGLLVGSGIALAVLFRVNKNIKENITLVAIIYAIGVISGIMLDLIS